jgi:hypothetical protein
VVAVAFNGVSLIVLMAWGLIFHRAGFQISRGREGMDVGEDAFAAEEPGQEMLTK